ncbi:hypothetical protein [Ruegeria sp. HKCCC2117]|uniref:hypothetical protein n=1 Tax=Ruegeria sp. HKCCC2117 TaxID=2682992 RepID=UPI00148877A4|nr:hypothetical protein [Ruegeria sp. HKCCC2117]
MKLTGAAAYVVARGLDPDYWRDMLAKFDAAGWQVDQVLRVTPGRRNQYSKR